jgi:ABC-type transport system substrate-binding protein
MSGELDDLIGQAVNYRGSLIGFIPDSMIELRDGLVWFSPEADKLIDAACEIYIETDDQMRVYELSRQLAGILNQLQPYITLYRHKTVLDAVTEKDGHWEPNDDLTIDLPARIQRIKEFGNRYSD